MDHRETQFQFQEFWTRVEKKWKKLINNSVEFQVSNTGPTTASFVYFRSFQVKFYRKTWIVVVQGEHADHLSSTTAQILLNRQASTMVNYNSRVV